MPELVICPLCLQSRAKEIHLSLPKPRYWHCPDCDLRFMDPAFHLSSNDEKARYLTHENDVNDLRYQAFVRPLYEVIHRRGPHGQHGLDFGAGTGPVLAQMLESSGYQVTRYDPYFWPDSSALEGMYDFIFSCEVVEHFYHPAVEFGRMRNLARPSGFLAIMTHLYENSCDFDSWYYRKDPTHVSFYSKLTFEWIARRFQFATVEALNNRIVILTCHSEVEAS